MTWTGAGFAREWRTGTAMAAVGVAAATGGLIAQPAALGEAGWYTKAAFAALASAAIVAVALLPLVLWRRTVPRPVWLTMAAAAVLLGLAAFSASGSIQRQCTAQYRGRAVAIGTEPTPLGVAYKRMNPESTPDDLLFDSLGAADLYWTRDSITRCRTLMAGSYYLWLPFLIVALAAAVQALPAAALPWSSGSTAIPSPRAAGPIRYDVFISYRHGGADAEAAAALLQALEAGGYTVAIDERDFPANASFLEEMERCVQHSRFTVAIVSTRYLESGNCREEAIVCKVLDMGERRRRLIPFVIAPVAMPAWLYGIVGIDCTKPDPMIDPVARLKATLGPPSAASQTGSGV